jgi:hypothetical protein
MFQATNQIPFQVAFKDLYRSVLIWHQQLGRRTLLWCLLSWPLASPPRCHNTSIPSSRPTIYMERDASGEYMNWILLKLIEYLHSLFNTVFFFQHIYVQCFFFNIATLSSGDGSGVIFVPTLTVFVEAFQIFPVSYPVPTSIQLLRFALSRGCLHPFLHLSLLITPGVLWLRPILEYFRQFMSVLFNRLPGRIFMELHGVFFTTAEVQTKDSNSTEDQLRRIWFSPRDIWLGFALKEWKRPYYFPSWRSTADCAPLAFSVSSPSNQDFFINFM